MPTREDHKAFLDRLRPLLAPSELSKVDDAYNLAKDRHRAQLRKEKTEEGKPVRYFEHPRAVALVLIDEIGCVDADAICEALLHDCLEDTWLRPEEIEQRFGTEVARTVIRLSKIPKEGYAEKLMKFGSWRELLIKACDHLHNRRTLHHGDLEWQKKQVIETETSYFPLLERLLEIIPQQYQTGATRLRDEIYQLISERREALSPLF